MFDPQDLASALVILTRFTSMAILPGKKVSEYCTEALQLHRDLMNVYWSDATNGPDYKQMFDEMSATVFIRSLPAGLGKIVRRELKVGPRNAYSLLGAIDCARQDRNLESAVENRAVSGVQHEISAFAGAEY